MSEHDFEVGYQAAMRRMVHEAMRSLNPTEMDVARLITERSETVARLREICEDHGDNEWPTDLYIPDVLEKHLANHLRGEEPGAKNHDESPLMPFLDPELQPGPLALAYANAFIGSRFGDWNARGSNDNDLARFFELALTGGRGKLRT